MVKEKIGLRDRFLLIGFGLFLIILIELFLRIYGYGYPEIKDDPFVGFKGINRLFGKELKPDGRWVYRTNVNKRQIFNYQEFPVKKNTNTVRIFVFGGSTTYGHPFDTRTSFSRWLYEGLIISDPEKRYEVINAGGISYASYRIVNIVKEVLEYDPDIFIFYMGHNEFLEDITYKDIKRQSEYLTTIQIFLNRIKVYTLIRELVLWLKERGDAAKTILSGEVNTILDKQDGLKKFSVYKEDIDNRIYHFSFNLKKIIALAQERDIKVILSTLPSNIRDFMPFKSLHKKDITKEELKRWEDYYRSGKDMYNAGKFELAISAFNSAYRIDHEYGDLLFLMAKSYDMLGNYGLAKRYYLLARDNDRAPLRAISDVNKTIRDAAYSNSTGFVDMERVFDNLSIDGIQGKDLFLDHCHPTIKGVQTIADELLKVLKKTNIIRGELNFSDIHKRYEMVMSRIDDEVYLLGKINIGRTLNWAEQYEMAREVLETAKKEYPDNAEIRYLIANTYRRLRMMDQALSELKIAKRLDPDNPEINKELGSLFASMGKLDDAISSYSELTEKKDKENVSQFSLGYLYSQKGEYKKAIAAYKEALRADPDMVDAHINLGNLYQLKGRFKDALNEYLTAKRIEPDNPAIYFNMGIVYEDMGKIDNSIASYKRAISYDKGYAEAYYNLAGIFYRTQRYDEAIDRYTIFSRLRPENPDVYNILGIIYNLKGEYDNALKHFDNALKIKDDYADVYNNKGIVYYFKGDYLMAEREYLKALKTNPDFSEAHRGIGLTYLKTDKKRKGLSHLKRSLELNPLQKKVEELKKIIDEVERGL
ncbi:MAG: tetratricopeptide repeat protein [Nitrospirota bacterium]